MEITKSEGLLMAEDRTQMSYDIRTLSERLMKINRQKAIDWPIMRKEYKSIAETDRMWELSELGLEEREIKVKIKCKEHGMSAIRTHLQALNDEARNNY